MRRILISFLLLPFLALPAESQEATKLQDPDAKAPVISPVLSMPEGRIQKTEGSVQPWRTEAPTDFSGRYRLYGITDGHGWLDVKVTKTAEPGSDPYRVEATLVTEWTKDDWSTLQFQGAFLERDTRLPYFEVGRRHFVGFFVEFTDKSEDKPKTATKAVIIGTDVFVRDDKYKPRSYRENTPAPASKREKTPAKG